MYIYMYIYIYIFFFFLCCLRVGADHHSIIPGIWEDLSSSLGGTSVTEDHHHHLDLQQLHDTLEFVTSHYLQRRLGEARTLYSIVHWDYTPAITEFLERVCGCMVAGWKESVESSAVRVDEGWCVCVHVTYACLSFVVLCVHVGLCSVVYRLVRCMQWLCVRAYMLLCVNMLITCTFTCA